MKHVLPWDEKGVVTSWLWWGRYYCSAIWVTLALSCGIIWLVMAKTAGGFITGTPVCFSHLNDQGCWFEFSSVLRKKLASIFSACIQSRPCASDCSHQHKKVQPTQFCSAMLTRYTMNGILHLFAKRPLRTLKSVRKKNCVYCWGTLSLCIAH